MNKLFSSIWKRLGSINLTVILCLLITVDLTWGYLCLKKRVSLFAPLNDMGLAPWISTYGLNNLAYTGWFFLLLGLLTFLCINTFVCTTDRVLPLIRSRRRFKPWRLFFKLAPHVMHYAMLVILAGYLISFLFSQVLVSRTLVPGASLTLPGTKGTVTFVSFDPVYYQGDRLDFFKDRIISPRAVLSLKDGRVEKRAVLSVNRPVRFKGRAIFLKNYAPKKRGGAMARKTRIDMTIRKDPGVWFYLLGMLLFTVGLGMYMAEWIVTRNSKKET